MVSQPTFSVEEIKTTGLDDLSVLARGLTPLLLDAWADQGPYWPDSDGRLAAAIALIDGWDYLGRADSPVYALFRLWVDDFYALGPSFGRENLPPVGSVSVADQQKMLNALDQATSFMMTNFGRLDPAWGDVHKMKRGSYVFPLAGGNHSLPSLRMTNTDSFSSGVWWATSGSSYMFVAALTDPVEFWSVRPLGESENQTSPFYADVSGLYSANQYKQVWMTLEDVQAHQTSATTLTYSPEQPPAVGGIAELPDTTEGSNDGAASTAGSPDRFARGYAVVAGGIVAVVLAATAGAWYARRRWPG